VLFAGATWIGGIDNSGKLRLAAQTYRQRGEDFWPGPMQEEGEANTENCLQFNTHYKATKDAIEHHKTLAAQYDVLNGGSIPVSEIPLSIRNWPAAGNQYFVGEAGAPIPLDVDRHLAPYIEYDGEQGYDPTKGDHPDIHNSNEGVFWVINDALHKHTMSDTGKPLGIEIRKLAYAYDRPGVLDSTTFYRFEYENFGQDLDSVYIAIWADPDLGNYDDDYVGCDTNRNMGIAYNGDAVDGGKSGYGEDPPYVGIDFLQVEAPGDQPDCGMSGFIYYHNNWTYMGNPIIPGDYYNYMKGLWKDSAYPEFPNGHARAGEHTPHMYYSEPDDTLAGAWSECTDGNTPFDRRFVMSSGPYTINKGETLTLDFAVIFARCPNYEFCPLFDCIQVASDKVQNFFYNELTGIAQNNELRADWQVFPNPASDKIVTKWEQPATGTLELINASGRVLEIKRLMHNTHFSMDIGDHPAGMYVLRLITADGQAARKVVLQD
jgi:hypothetical protein